MMKSEPVTEAGKPVRTWRGVLRDGRVLESPDAGEAFQWADLFTGELKRFEVVSPVHGVILRVHLGPEDRLIYRDRSRVDGLDGQFIEARYLIGFQRKWLGEEFMALVEVGDDGRVTVSPGFVDGQKPVNFMECELP
jgi:hypothetical protein